jgi:hypothetical protein
MLFYPFKIEKQKIVTFQTLNIIVSCMQIISPSDISKAYYLRFNNDLLFSISVLNRRPNVVCPSEDYRNALTLKKE